MPTTNICDYCKGDIGKLKKVIKGRKNTCLKCVNKHNLERTLKRNAKIKA